MKRLTYLCLWWLLGCVSHSSQQTPPGAQPEPMASPGPSITPTLPYPLSTPTPAPLSEYPYLLKSQLSVLAGSEKTGYQDGFASQALFNGILDIAFNAQKELFITEKGTPVDANIIRIRKMGIDKRVSTYLSNQSRGFKDGPLSIAQFKSVSGLALDAESNLLIADSLDHRIRKITPAGEVSTFAGTGQAGTNALTTGPASSVALLNPQKIVFVPPHQLYIFESRALRVIDTLKMEIQNPLLIRTDPLQENKDFNPLHPYRTPLGYPIGEPGDAAFTESDAYILDRSRQLREGDRSWQVLLKWNLKTHQLEVFAGGKYTSSVDGKGQEAGFRYLYDIILSKRGYLLVADNNCLRKVSLDGEVTSLNLCGTAADYIGLARYPQALQLGTISALAEDSEGNLIIAEENRLLKIQMNEKPMPQL
ncbi:MAG: hypothetical protein IV090_08445 [Candidatus Sericytochromatia bacterium]|nr:hypothetical protein [Candidatus Sericytochromatia bacterium]